MSDKPQSDGNGVLIAASVLIFLVAGAVIGSHITLAVLEGSPALVQRTKVTLKNIADELDTLVSDEGRYVRVHQSPGVDAWGRDLKVSYLSEGCKALVETLEVRSAGPNGEFGDRDDLVVRRRNVVRGAALANVKDTAAATVKGLIEGLKGEEEDGN